jgi:Arc/MetJ family transcription regulator
MRTNIQLDDDLVDEARKYSAAKTKRGLIEEALVTFVKVKEEEHRRASYRDRLSKIQRRLSGVRLREQPSNLLHQDRSR